jgi:mono/diheme cytochrome c family protein
MKPLRIFIAAVLTFAALACGSTNPANTAVDKIAPSPSSPVPQATPYDDLAMGRQIYSTSCAACHKEDGTGGKITIEGKSISPDDLTSDKIKKFTDDKIIGYIYNGVEDEGMPAFKDDLSEAQIREVVRFIRSGIQKMPQETSPVKNR